LIKKIAIFLGTSGYVGLIPFAPGTFGAIVGSISYYLLDQYYSIDINLMLILLSIVFTIIGTWCCKILLKDWGHDPSRIVIDETVGQWITYLFIPLTFKNLVVGLILFRFFDILKPLGIKKIDRDMHNPFSVMLDDIVAGFYALICLHIILYLT